jgi:hypothetical protein
MINVINSPEEIFFGEENPKTNFYSYQMLNEATDIFTVTEIMNNVAIESELKFHEKFKELEDYLSMIVEDQSSNQNKEIQMDDKLALAKAKAKEYFKNSAYEVIRSLKTKFEENGLHHLVSQGYLQMLIEKTKSDMMFAFKKVHTNILQSFSPISDTNKTPAEQKLAKKNKKGKTKIPKKALLILKNWLTEHFNDPYPSYKEKAKLANEAGITLKQVQNWFTNARGRIWRKTCNQEKFLNLIEEKLVENEKKKSEILSESYAIFNNKG